MWKCRKCGLYLFNDQVKCGCKVFTVIDEEGDRHEISAIDEEEAALKYAKESNVDGEYYLLHESAIVSVNGKKYRISAEESVEYFADEIETEED